MDTVVTIVQILLGLAFVAAGASHLRLADVPTPPPRMAWAAAVSPAGLRMIAVLELVGGAVVVVTALIGPAWLGALTAVCFVLLMVAAAIFHLRRPGEVSNAFFNLILGAVALIIAYANLV